MKIVPIFAEKLFAFHFDNEDENEYEKNIEFWTNVEELLKFAKANIPGINYAKYVEERLEEAEEIIDLIEEIAQNDYETLDQFFRPLSDNEYIIVSLSLQKGKLKRERKRSDLRLYAIRIDENCFVITGGAIKLSQTMQENELTQKELDKLKMCRQYLKENGVFDSDSFFELLTQSHDE